MAKFRRNPHKHTQTHFHLSWLAPPLHISPAPFHTSITLRCRLLWEALLWTVIFISKYTINKLFQIQTSTQYFASQHFFAACHQCKCALVYLQCIILVILQLIMVIQILLFRYSLAFRSSVCSTNAFVTTRDFAGFSVQTKQ